MVAKATAKKVKGSARKQTEVCDEVHTDPSQPHMTYARLAQIRHSFSYIWHQDSNESEPGESKRPSRRGEHVINNNVLNVYKDIVQSFVNEVIYDNLDDMIKSGRLSTNCKVVKAINQPIPGPTADFIRYQMVVFYEEEYIDKNAMTYGREIELLRNTVVNYMTHVHKGIVHRIPAGEQVNLIPALERDVRDSVEMFIAGEYFVDYEVLDKWLEQKGNDREQFEIARQEVISMFRNLVYDDGNDVVITWVN